MKNELKECCLHFIGRVLISRGDAHIPVILLPALGTIDTWYLHRRTTKVSVNSGAPERLISLDFKGSSQCPISIIKRECKLSIIYL